MRILLTNTALRERTGSELYVAELASALRARGHEPVAYSPRLGAVAEAMRAGGTKVADTLKGLERPDVIHGQHHLQTMAALLAFPGVPGVFFCHGVAPFEETPFAFRRLLRHVAVDDAVAERLREAGIPPARIVTIRNFVDLAKFRRRTPLPERPRRALLFSNYAREETHLPAVREACARAGLAFDVAGLGSGRPLGAPEEALPGYDVVFAKGRAALEALAVGCAVVLCDATGAGPMVTAAELPRLRALNLGFRLLTPPVSPERLLAEMARYDPADAARVCDAVRGEAGLGSAVERIEALYGDVVREGRWRFGGRGEEMREASSYLEWLDAHVRSGAEALHGVEELRRRLEDLERPPPAVP